MRNNTSIQPLGAAILGAFIALAGFFVYCGIDNYAMRDRYVTVKGLSEREVNANFVTWSVKTKLTGNSEAQLLPLIEQKKDDVVNYLRAHGISKSEISNVDLTITDRSEYYDWDRRKSYTDRYEACYALTVVSDDVAKVRELSLTHGELYKAGIADGGESPIYSYTALNDLKPEMVEEATSNARLVASKFAKDADCSLGSIRSARQGQFEVTSDDLRPWIRKIRVVTSIDYYLK